MIQVEYPNKAGKMPRSPMRRLALGICTVFLLGSTIAGCAANGGGSSDNPQSSSGSAAKTPVSMAVNPVDFTPETLQILWAPVGSNFLHV